jgi:hypothetical protein
VPIESESGDDIPFTGKGWFPVVYPAGIACEFVLIHICTDVRAPSSRVLSGISAIIRFPPFDMRTSSPPVRPFINNLYWNFNGFDQASHYSRMVPKGTLRNGIGGSLLLVSSAYLLPIMIATGATDIEQAEWTNGSFARAATEIGGRWLGE